jgi:hypothetical protein
MADVRDDHRHRPTEASETEREHADADPAILVCGSHRRARWMDDHEDADRRDEESVGEREDDVEDAPYGELPPTTLAAVRRTLADAQHAESRRSCTNTWRREAAGTRARSRTRPRRRTEMVCASTSVTEAASRRPVAVHRPIVPVLADAHRPGMIWTCGREGDEQRQAQRSIARR